MLCAQSNRPSLRDEDEVGVAFTGRSIDVDASDGHSAPCFFLGAVGPRTGRPRLRACPAAAGKLGFSMVSLVRSRGADKTELLFSFRSRFHRRDGPAGKDLDERGLLGALRLLRRWSDTISRVSWLMSQ
jgi:hypothetical protein